MSSNDNDSDSLKKENSTKLVSNYPSFISSFKNFFEILIQNQKNSNFLSISNFSPPDFSIECGDGVELKVHKVILILRSEYFQDLFSSGFQESKIEKMKKSNINSETMIENQNGKMKKPNINSEIMIEVNFEKKNS